MYEYQTIWVAETIPYSTNKELKEIADKYYKDTVLKIYKDYVYIERIELVA